MMNVEIILNNDEGDEDLSLNSCPNDEYVFIKIGKEGKINHAIIKIDELKQALRKLTTK